MSIVKKMGVLHPKSSTQMFARQGRPVAQKYLLRRVLTGDAQAEDKSSRCCFESRLIPLHSG